MKWFWGLLVISIGIIILGSNLSWWTSAQIKQLANFWPLILILFGVSLLFRFWRFGWIIILLVFLLSLFLVYDALSSHPIITSKLAQEREIKTFPLSVDLPTDIKKAEINIKTGAISLNVQGDSEKLLTGEMKSGFLEPNITTRQDGEKIIIDITTNKFNSFSWKAKNNLNIALTNNIPIDINVDAGASSLDFDFSKIQLSKLDLNAGASSMKIIFGQETLDNTEISIDAGASSIDFETPKELGVEIKTETGLSSKDFGDYTKIDNQTYQSKDYNTVSKKIKITIKAGASSIKSRTN